MCFGNFNTIFFFVEWVLEKAHTTPQRQCNASGRENRMSWVFCRHKTTFCSQFFSPFSRFNFTNILWTAFLYESVLRSFSALTVWVCNFLSKVNWHKSCSCWWNWLWVFIAPRVNSTKLCYYSFFWFSMLSLRFLTYENSQIYYEVAKLNIAKNGKKLCFLGLGFANVFHAALSTFGTLVPKVAL